MAANEKRIAVDTSYLIDLALGEAFAVDLFNVLWRWKAQLYLTSSPANALRSVAANEPDARRRRGAQLAIPRLNEWGIIPGEITPEGLRLADAFSWELRTAGLLPMQERQDGMLPAEASMADCHWLASDDRHFGKLTDEVLARYLKKYHLKPVRIVMPRDLARRLRKGIL